MSAHECTCTRVCVCVCVSGVEWSGYRILVLYTCNTMCIEATDVDKVQLLCCMTAHNRSIPVRRQMRKTPGLYVNILQLLTNEID